MKRFLKIVVGLGLWTAGLLLAFDAINLWLMRHSGSCSAIKMAQAFDGGQPGEIGIFGSSRAINNYAPSVISARAFNYGEYGMCAWETLFVVSQYLAQQKAGVVIINLEPWGFPGSSEYGPVGNYKLVNPPQELRGKKPFMDMEWTDLIPGLRFQGGLKANLVKFLNARKPTTRKIDHGAELILESRTPEEWKILNQTVKSSDFIFTDEAQRAVDDLYARKGDVKIVWVVAPISPIVREKYIGREKLQSFIEAQNKIEGVWAINLMDDAADFPTEMFQDPTHCNIHGAERFSRKLKAELEARLLLQTSP